MSTSPDTTPLVPILFFGAILVVIGVGVYFAYLAEKKRTAALADVALRTGFTFEPKVDKEMLPTLGSFHLFRVGHSHRGRNLMRGKSGDAAVVVLDYWYTIGGGKNSHTYSQTVAIYPGAGSAAALPEFTLVPEHWWDKIGDVLGHHDIDFEASEEFSKRYLLKGPDEAAIRTLFGAEPLGFFAQNQGWAVDSAGGALAVYRWGRRAKPEEMQPFLAETAAVRRTLVHD